MNKKYIIISVIITIILILGATYAWLTWRSTENTELTLTIGELADVMFEEGNDISTNSLGPVLNYEDGETTEFRIRNKSEEELKTKIILNITTLSEELKDDSVKYKLLTSTDNITFTEIKSDTFKNIIIGENEIVNEITKAGNTYYKFIIYIDGNMENNINMLDKQISGTITVDVSVPNLDTSGANSPDLVEGLIPIMYNGTTWVKADKANGNEEYQWYDYNAKKWANAVLVSSTNRQTYIDADAGTPIPESDILAYYVWIPRYRYKVWNKNKVVGTDSYNAQTSGIDIEFEPDTETNGTITCTYSYAAPSSSANSPNETCTGSNGDYYTHPAFDFGGEPLRGIWVGKFEISSTNQTESNYGGGQSTSLSVRIKPNVISWRNNNVTYFSYVIQAMTNNTTYGTSTDSDSHMMKNLEWGAVAYLTHSDYGLCTNESCSKLAMNGFANSTYYTTKTGCGPYTSGSTSYSTTCNAYNTTIGMEASTTGNIYGVYDMAGGAGEYVMGNMSSISGYYSYYARLGGNQFTYSDATAKYIDTYAYGGSNRYQIAYNRARLGDATGEVVLAESVQNGWYGNSSDFPYASEYPWFYRGGGYGGIAFCSGCGVFAFIGIDGNIVKGNSARAVLVGI